MPSASIYNCTAHIITDGGNKLSIYKSTKSGMTVCIAETNGPIVGGYICVATEAHDDDGLPHTLEHLVFMGSEKYPYKGVLDLLASRCLAQGTNAWTDTDHTCYTMTAAGDEGFLKLLPIYLDHILYPTLSENAYVTEVHHVNGEGEDAGVIYCEMQARENTGENLCHYAMLRAMYPGHCGYKYETGGVLKNLRESTSNEKVIQYHKDFYRPENICIIIVGQIEADKVFEALQPVEDRIAQDDVNKTPFVRPWQTPVPPLPESVTLEVQYPADEVDYGMIIAAWRGPLASDYSQLISIQILMDYLTDTSVSPLNRDLIEVDDPLCNQVDYTVIENSESCIYLHFSDVPVKHLEALKEKMLSLLKGIADGKETLDLSRMKTVINKKKLYILTSMESSPHDQLAQCLIGDFLYGTTIEDLRHRVQEIPAIEKLYNMPAEFWINLLKTYITDANYVIVLGKPCAKLSKKLSADEKKRIEAQKQTLGPDGLNEKARLLKEAIAAAESNPPKEILQSVAIPSVDSIKFHPIKRRCNVSKTVNCERNFDIQSMPCRFQLDEINTSFVRCSVLMDSSSLSHELRMYLPLYVELLGECGIMRDGSMVPYQEVVRQLEDDTIGISTTLGLHYRRYFPGKFAQAVGLECMVEEEKYDQIIQWSSELLYETVFEPARIKSSINKMITSVGSLKCKGSSVLKTIMKSLVFREESNQWISSMLKQHRFLTKVLEDLETKADEVVAQLNSLRDIITQPEKVTVHLAVNLDNLKKKVDPEKPWIESFFPKNLQPKISNSSITKCHELLKTDVGEDYRGLIVGIGSLDNSFMIQCTTCLTSHTDPDYAPLLVMLQYLIQMEGPLWRQIRGHGLAYSYDIFVEPENGQIYLLIAESNNLKKCYEETKKVVDHHLKEASAWEPEFLESSASSVVFDIIDKIKTVADVTEESLRAYLQGIDENFTQQLLKEVSEVSTEDLMRVGVKYLLPLFDCSLSKCVICCNPSKVEETVDDFSKISRKLNVLASLDDSYLIDF